MPPRSAKLRAELPNGDLDRRVGIVETITGGISTRLDDLSASTAGQNAAMRDIASSVKEISERLRKIENEFIGVMTALQQQMTAAFQRIDETRSNIAQVKAEHEKDLGCIKEDVKLVKGEIPEKLRERMEKIENVLPGLITANKIMIFMASVITASLVGLVWAVFTGQASIIFK